MQMPSDSTMVKAPRIRPRIGKKYQTRLPSLPLEWDDLSDTDQYYLNELPLIGDAYQQSHYPQITHGTSSITSTRDDYVSKGGSDHHFGVVEPAQTFVQFHEFNRNTEVQPKAATTQDFESILTPVPPIELQVVLAPNGSSEVTLERRALFDLNVPYLEESEEGGEMATKKAKKKRKRKVYDAERRRSTRSRPPTASLILAAAQGYERPKKKRKKYQSVDV